MAFTSWLISFDVNRLVFHFRRRAGEKYLNKTINQKEQNKIDP